TPTCGDLRDELQRYMLRRRLGAGSRDLRALLDPLFPGEQASVRSLLQRFADVHPPPRAEAQSTVFARSGASTGEVRGGGPAARPVIQRHSPLAAGDVLDFGEIDSIGDAAGPGGVS